MSSESSDHELPPPPPPELISRLPNESDFGKNRLKWLDNKIQSQIPTDILLITANENEFAACYGEMENVRRSWYDTLGIVDFGQFIDNKDVKVTLMKCAQGPTEAVIAVKNAADVLYPKVVLFVGICATMKPEKAKLGDVVISAKLATYADIKTNPNGTIEDRGFKTDISRNMKRLILHPDAGWEPPLKDSSSFQAKVHYRNAVILSGPELVNNHERRQELAKYRGEALALEMEGAGLYPAAKDLGIEWAVVKAVSDYADGSKSVTKDWQPFSSAMAASLVRNMFKHDDVIENWPHYKNIDPRIGVDDGKRPRQEERLNRDEIDAKRPRQEERSNKDEIDAKKPRKEERPNEDEPASNMCNSCRATNEYELPDNRNEWPIDKIENSFIEKIYMKLDNRSSGKLLSALGGFNQDDADTMRNQFPTGIGLAEEALRRWGAASGKNNVGALKNIVDHKLGRNDVRQIIERWEEVSVCHGCGKKLDN